MRKSLLILATLLLSACNSDDNSNSNNDNSTPDTGGVGKQYASKALGPTQLNNTVSMALIVSPNNPNETVSGQPAVTFNQQNGQLTIIQGQGIRAAEATFLLMNEQTLASKSCGYLEAIEQPASGCIMTISADDLSKIHLSAIQLFDPQGNLITTSIQ
ncbi:hypothetical protein ACUYOF_20465 [Photobacterium ganghwense]|uniref:hypothetical protein n=1 Tax=Photobacterium ganghwense TaxID=320778 RepID=UPI004055FE02